MKQKSITIKYNEDYSSVPAYVKQYDFLYHKINELITKEFETRNFEYNKEHKPYEIKIIK